MKPSPLDLDPNYMASLQMLDSKALLDRLESHKRRELGEQGVACLRPPLPRRASGPGADRAPRDTCISSCI